MAMRPRKNAASALAAVFGAPAASRDALVTEVWRGWKIPDHPAEAGPPGAVDKVAPALGKPGSRPAGAAAGRSRGAGKAGAPPGKAR